MSQRNIIGLIVGTIPIVLKNKNYQRSESVHAKSADLTKIENIKIPSEDFSSEKSGEGLFRLSRL